MLSAIRKITPDLGQAGGSQTSAPLVAKAERTIRPEAIAFGVFGLITFLAALVIGGQVVSRLVRRNAEDGAILRALGAGPAMTICDGLIGVVGAVLAGAVLAVAVAVGLSPLAPIGPVRPVYPDRGVAFDGMVLGLGFVLLVVVLSGSAVAVAYRASAHRASRARGDVGRGSSLARAAAACGLPAAAVTGVRAALGPASGREAAPVRSALLGSVIAVVVVAASITFGSSLSFLVSRPALYGWNWDYALLAGFGRGEPARGRNRLPAQSRPGGGSLDRGVLRAHEAGWAGYSRSGQQPERAGRPAAPVWARPAGGVTGSARARHPGPVAQAGRRHGRRRHRARSAGPLDDCRHRPCPPSEARATLRCRWARARSIDPAPSPAQALNPQQPPCRPRWPCSSRPGPA